MHFLKLLLLVPLVLCSCKDNISTGVVKNTPAEAPTESTYKVGDTLWKASISRSAHEELSISSFSKSNGAITLKHRHQVGSDGAYYRTDTVATYTLGRGETIEIASNISSKKVHVQYVDATDRTLSIKVTEE